MPSQKLKGKTILLTGANSMIGRETQDQLNAYGADVVGMYGKSDFDLTTPQGKSRVLSEVNYFEVDYVIHLAGYNGNIDFNRKQPYRIFHDTTMMTMNVLDACMATSVKKVVLPISSCAYPHHLGILKEEDFWNGEPHPSVSAHGFAKRVGLEYGRQLNKLDGPKVLGVCFNTVYGPHDSFDLHKTKVIGSLIKKFVDAERKNERYVTLWGDGQSRREFIHVQDAVSMMLYMMCYYDGDFDYPINVGWGKDHKIEHLADAIKHLTGFKGEIMWDRDKPNGQRVKLLDNSKMMEIDQYFKPTYSLTEGLRDTIQWYKENY